MKVLAIAKVNPKATPEEFQCHLETEVRHAWKLHKEGVCREMYDRQDRLGVVFVLECSSVDEARKLLDELPYVRENLIGFELIPLQPFLYFEGLFRDVEPPQQG